MTDIEALQANHADEIELLGRYIEEYGLEQRVNEIVELVKRDAADVDGDVNPEDDDEAMGEDGDVTM